jgi:sporulation protein YhbH
MAIIPYKHVSGGMDRTAGDRARHKRKIKDAFKNNIADIVADESIIGQSGDKIIKVPIKGIKEYKFVYGKSNSGVAQGNGDTRRGDLISGKNSKDKTKDTTGGNEAGEDIYETEITLGELIDIMFEDLQLPDMEQKKLREVMSERHVKLKGHRKQGIRPRLDKKKTMKEYLKRQMVNFTEQLEIGQTLHDIIQNQEEIPAFREDDLRYDHIVEDMKKQSNAVVVCMMDTSGSMGQMEKYLARTFFFFLYQFVKMKYENCKLVFISHSTEANEVTENEFFHKGESGGTIISSAYLKAIEIIQNRFDPVSWNVYAFHISDGDNYSNDNHSALEAAIKLNEMCNLFGYGEIAANHPYSSGETIYKFFEGRMPKEKFGLVKIQDKTHIFEAFRQFFAKAEEKGE